MRIEGSIKAAVNYIGGALLIFILLLITTQIAADLDDYAIWFAANVSNLGNIDTDYLTTLQTIISTALATFLGAWFAFRWQHRKEIEERDKSFLRQIELLIFYVGTQIDYLKLMRNVFTQHKIDYCIPSFHFVIAKPKQWDISSFDLLICEASAPLMSLSGSQDALPVVYQQIESIRSFLSEGDRIRSLVDYGCQRDLWLWSGSKEDLASAIGKDSAEEYVFANDNLVKAIDQLIRNLDSSLANSMDLLLTNTVSAKSASWWKSRQREVHMPESNT